MDSEVFNDFRMIARRLLGDTDGNTALAQWLDWKDRKGKAAPMCTHSASRLRLTLPRNTLLSGFGKWKAMLFPSCSA